MTGNPPPIHEYVCDGNLVGVLDELAKGTNVDVKDPDTDRTPLMAAVASPKANVDLVRLLIQKGAIVNAVASDKNLVVAQEFVEEIRATVNEKKNTALAIPIPENIKSVLEKMQPFLPPAQKKLVIRETVLSIAIAAGNFDKIKTLLDAGADVRYQRPHRYDALIDVMHGRTIAYDPQLVPIIKLLIERGARLNTVSAYSESALSVSSNDGRFDAVRVLLDAGADSAPLQWTPLMHAIALGSLDDVRTQLKNGADLSARDFWSRTPWLLSLQTGDVAKARLLLVSGASRIDRGRCGKPPLMYPIGNRDTKMLLWLLSIGCNPNDTNEFGSTPLMEASEAGATESVTILIDAGADFQLVSNSEPAIRLATNLDIVRLLVTKGADLNDISDEMRATLTKLPFDGKIRISRDEYLAAKHRRFGRSNPEKMNFALWRSMIKSGANAYTARNRFNDTDSDNEPIWCFKRFGKSINELPDGRIIEIAGEHEDHYDPDFCIYNDVIVHHGDGTFDIYGYPKECFPPTDFHSATLVGNHIYIIGNLGYPGERKYGETQVYRVNTDSLEIERVATSGQLPGWISNHKATLCADGKIRISGGKICAMKDGAEEYLDNSTDYVLDLGTLAWTRIA